MPMSIPAQLSDQPTLLHWTRNMIAPRKLSQGFGRGTLEFLDPEDRKLPVSFDLSDFVGTTPIEKFGYVSLPAITEKTVPAPHRPVYFLLVRAAAVISSCFLIFEVLPGGTFAAGQHLNSRPPRT
jgi:maltose alpha-D-glucosyltransferase/alpha-amylase